MSRYPKKLFHNNQKFKKNTLISLICCIIGLGGYVISYYWGQIYLQHFILSSQQQLSKHHYDLSFTQSRSISWSLLPTITLDLPKIQWKNPGTGSLSLWQMQSIAISYNPIHPLSFSVKILGNQMICPNTKDQTHCYYLYHEPIHIILPIQSTYIHGTALFRLNNLFSRLQNLEHPEFNSVQLQTISGKIHWNLNQHSAFTHLKIKKTFLSFQQYQPLSIQHLTINMAIQQDQQDTATGFNMSHQTYKLLIQNFSGKWKELFFNITGKINLLTPSRRTGNLLIYFENINRIFAQELSKILYYQNRQINLSQLQLPSHITIPLLIRNHEIYIGNIPLITIYNQQYIPLQNLLNRLQTSTNNKK